MLAAGAVRNLELIVLGVGAIVGVFVAMILLFALRAHRREQERGEPKPEPKKTRDPWVEAGKRAVAPSSSELEQVIGEPRKEGPRGRPIVLVTGAARRVGRAVALQMAGAGCDVYFTYHQSGEEAESLARELAALGSTGSFHQVDLSDKDQIEALARDLSGTLSRLDVLVHNASVYSASPIGDMSMDEVVKQYQVNAAAPLVLTARLASLLGKSELKGGAAVIAFTDIHAMGRPRREFAAYSMSKAAVTEMVYSLARDLAPVVRVNGVAPGVVAWPEDGLEADEDAQRKYVRRIPLARAGTPEDAAGVVRWLAFEATYLTGEIIRVDGGRWLT